MDNNNDKFYQYIFINPGCYFRKIKRELGYSVGTTQYQLNKLEKEGKIVSYSDGFYKSYFANGLFDENEKKILQILNQKSLREILLLIIENKNLTKQDIVKKFEISYSTATWYLEKLIDSNLILEKKNGKFTLYFVNPDVKTTPITVQLLKKYYSNIWNTWANRLAEFFLLLSKEEGR